MDTSSVITQVYREDDALNSHQTSEKATLALPATKRERPSFLKQMFCCFRPINANRNASSGCNSNNNKHNNNNCASQLLRSEDKNERNVARTGSDLETKHPKSEGLLSPLCVQDKHKKCVVIDLDETLVHSSFTPVNNPDFIIPVEIDGTIHQVYVLKRPYVDDFLKKMGELFECVLFTASLGKYADPVTDLLDKWGVFRARLFRESCVFHRGNYVKDLSRLGRDLNRTVILDNSPASYLFHPENAVPIVSWFDDPQDRELLDLLSFFERLAGVDDVYEFLGSSTGKGLDASGVQITEDQGTDDPGGEDDAGIEITALQIGDDRENNRPALSASS